MLTSGKRGISPLIATVLILGFTVALAAIIMTWGTGFVKKMQETTEETATKQIESADIMVNVKNYQLVGNSVTMMLENSGSKKIEKFKARISGSKGAETKDVSESLDAYGIKSISFTWTNDKVGAVKEIELLPIVSLGGKEYVSVNTPAKIEEDELGTTEEYSFIDLFDTYNEAEWSKDTRGGDVTNVNGEMKMVGTGINWYTNFWSDVSYDRSKKPTLKVDFKTDTLDEGVPMHIGTDGTSQVDGSYRRHVVQMRSTGVFAQWYNPAQGYQLLFSPAKADTWYTLEIEFDSIGSKLYVYEKGSSKPSTPQHAFTKTDWNPKFHFWVYRGIGYVDNAMVVYKG